MLSLVRVPGPSLILPHRGRNPQRILHFLRALLFYRPSFVFDPADFRSPTQTLSTRSIVISSSPQKLCPSECWHYSHRLSATIQTCQRLQLPTKTTRASPNSSVYVQTYNYDRKVVLIVDPINLWGYFYRLFVHRVIHFASFVHIVSYSSNFDEFI